MQNEADFKYILKGALGTQKGWRNRLECSVNTLQLISIAGCNGSFQDKIAPTILRSSAIHTDNNSFDGHPEVEIIIKILIYLEVSNDWLLYW